MFSTLASQPSWKKVFDAVEESDKTISAVEEREKNLHVAFEALDRAFSSASHGVEEGDEVILSQAAATDLVRELGHSGFDVDRLTSQTLLHSNDLDLAVRVQDDIVHGVFFFKI